MNVNAKGLSFNQPCDELVACAWFTPALPGGIGVVSRPSKTLHTIDR